ncbi:MAG: hypothetical protein KDA58_02730 [Planctomycetaceae bacterium]|nr:hypothetical protein [Planctomycetaceae bacterium]
MSTAAPPQPIAGVSANRESVLETVYPGVACNPIGRLIGGLMGGASGIGPLPVRLLALVIVGSVLAPLGALIYFWIKVFGPYYVFTNRSVQERKVRGNDLTQQVNLADIDQVDVVLGDGYEFHQCGDVRLLNARGDVLLTLPALPSPQRAAHVILEAREARVRADESLKVLQSRG